MNSPISPDVNTILWQLALGLAAFRVHLSFLLQKRCFRLCRTLFVFSYSPDRVVCCQEPAPFLFPQCVSLFSRKFLLLCSIHCVHVPGNRVTSGVRVPGPALQCSQALLNTLIAPVNDCWFLSYQPPYPARQDRGLRATFSYVAVWFQWKNRQVLTYWTAASFSKFRSVI